MAQEKSGRTGRLTTRAAEPHTARRRRRPSARRRAHTQRHFAPLQAAHFADKNLTRRGTPRPSDGRLQRARFRTSFCTSLSLSTTASKSPLTSSASSSLNVSSGRSSTKVSKLARSSRARRRVGRSQLVENEVDTDYISLQVLRTSRRSRRRKPESASAAANSATGKATLNTPESNMGRRLSSRSTAPTSCTFLSVGIRQILDPFGLIGLLTGSGGLRPPRICCPRLRHSGRLHTLFEL